MNTVFKKIGLPSITDIAYIGKKNIKMKNIFNQIVNGSLLFNNLDKLHPSFKLITYKSSNGENKKIDHYNIKQFLFPTADLKMYIKDAKGKIYELELKVRLPNGVGGSIALTDFGIHNTSDMLKFLDLFNDIHTLNIDTVSINIDTILIDKFIDHIYYKMAREIIEETTPDGKQAMNVSDIISSLSLKDSKIDIYKGIITISYIFNSTKSFPRVRELDQFPILYRGKEQDIYCIYTNSKEKQYFSKLPYIDNNQYLDFNIETNNISSFLRNINNIYSYSSSNSDSDLYISNISASPTISPNKSKSLTKSKSKSKTKTKKHKNNIKG